MMKINTWFICGDVYSLQKTLIYALTLYTYYMLFPVDIVINSIVQNGKWRPDGDKLKLFVQGHSR